MNLNKFNISFTFLPNFSLHNFSPFRLQIPPCGAKWLTLRNTAVDSHPLNKFNLIKFFLYRSLVLKRSNITNSNDRI